MSLNSSGYTKKKKQTKLYNFPEKNTHNDLIHKNNWMFIKKEKKDDSFVEKCKKK